MNKFHFIYYKFILGIFLFKLGIFEWESVNKDIDYKFILIGMVLKTGPDRPVRPVQPGTGIQSGPVIAKNWK